MLSDANKICALAIDFTLDPVGLLGAPWEYAPYIESYATFGGYRMCEYRDNLKSLDPTTDDPLSPIPLPAAFAEEKEVTLISGENRLPSRFASTRHLEYTLPDWRHHRGEDAIRFKFFAHTRFSGVPFLDKYEAGHVERERPQGVCVLELSDLFTHYKKLCAQDPALLHREEVSFQVEDMFMDRTIVVEKLHALAGTNELTPELYNKYAPLAQATTTKATARFQVTLHGFNHETFAHSTFARPNMKKSEIYSLLPPHMMSTNTPTKNGPAFQPLLYNSERCWAKMATAIQSVVETYCDTFVKMSEDHTPRFKPSEAALANLHMPLFAAEEGHTVLDNYWSCHEPFFRQYHSEEARQEALRLYALTEKTEAYFLMMLRSSLRRHGLSETSFVRCIEQHFSPENKSHKMDPLMLLADEVVVDIGTFVSTSAYYTADYRLMNTETTMPEAATTPQEAALKRALSAPRPDPESHHHLSHQKHVHRALRAAGAASCVKCGRVMQAKVVMCDSWDNHLVNGTSMCDDCEGQGNTAGTVVLQYSVGRHALGHKWQSRTLEAVRLYLRHTEIGALGSLVTSAFMNTDNSKMEMQASDELPLIGSAMDLSAQNDGHAFDIGQSLAKTVRQMERGNLPRDLVAEMKRETFVSEAFQAREKMRGVLVMEGTGQTETRMLDLETSYGTHSRVLFNKRRAEMACMRKIRLLFKADKTKYERVAGLFNGRGMTHYVAKQDPRRRVSAFYRSPMHMIVVGMKRRFGNHPALTQLVFCKKMDGELRSGVTMGELLRDEGGVDGPALVSPFAGDNTRMAPLKWQSEILPVVETIENQMPVMRFSRYSDEDYEHNIYSLFVTRTEAASPQFMFGQLKAPAARLDKERAEARQQFEKKVFGVEKDDATTLLRLYSRTWKLDKNVDDRLQLLKFFDTMPGMRDYAFYIERHMPNLEATLEIVVLLDVAACLKLEAAVPNVTSTRAAVKFDSWMTLDGGKKGDHNVQTQPRKSTRRERNREAVRRAEKLARRIEAAAAKLMRQVEGGSAEMRMLVEEVKTMSVEIEHELALAESASESGDEEEGGGGNEKDPLVPRPEMHLDVDDRHDDFVDRLNAILADAGYYEEPEEDEEEIPVTVAQMILMEIEELVRATAATTVDVTAFLADFGRSVILAWPIDDEGEVKDVISALVHAYIVWPTATMVVENEKTKPGSEKAPLVASDDSEEVASDDSEETIVDPAGAREALLDYLQDRVMHFFLFSKRTTEGQPSRRSNEFFDDIEETLDLMAASPSKIINAFHAALNRILGDAKLFRDLFYRADETAGARIRVRVAEAMDASGLSPYVKRRIRGVAGEGKKPDPLLMKAEEHIIKWQTQQLENSIKTRRGNTTEKKIEKALLMLRKHLDQKTRNMPAEKKQQYFDLVKKDILMDKNVVHNVRYHVAEVYDVKNVLRKIADMTGLIHYVVIDRHSFPGWESEEEEETISVINENVRLKISEDRREAQEQAEREFLSMVYHVVSLAVGDAVASMKALAKVREDLVKYAPNMPNEKRQEFVSLVKKLILEDEDVRRGRISMRDVLKGIAAKTDLIDYVTTHESEEEEQENESDDQ